MLKSLNTEQFVEKARAIHGNKYDYNKVVYSNSRNNVIITCPIHGDFEQPAYRHIHLKNGCFKCSHIVPMTTESFIKQSLLKHGNSYSYNKTNYINKTTKVTITCPLHGDFEQFPKSHIRGQGCYKCYSNNRFHTTEQFIEKARSVHNNNYEYSKVKYINDSGKVIITCLKHGDFKQQAGSHLQNHGCPECKIISKGENKIIEILKKLNIKFIKEFSINKTKYRYDFYLEDYNLLLEYDGKQHFVANSWSGIEGLKDIQKRDEDKNRIAFENGYKIKRISYKDFNKIEYLLLEVLGMTTQAQQRNKLVLFTDGACRPNPGFAGFGIYGFMYTDADKPKNHKHPHHGTLYFTPAGVLREKSETPIAVSHVLEMIYAVGNPQSTNNEAELKAIIASLKKASTLENLTSVSIWTDSGYIVNAFNENLQIWMNNGWRRIDGKVLSHIPQWEEIVRYRDLFKEKGCELTVSWVKGHTEPGDENYSYCNNMADIYSVIGCNYARINTPSEDTIVMDNMLTYADYKKSFADKDLVFYFREMYFSSDKDTDDRNYCFMSTSDDAELLGKRNNSSIFATNIGYIPPVINKIKEFYREITRSYVTTCCLKINKLENKDIYRLSEYVDARLMLLPMPSQPRTYLLVGDKTPFLYENSVKFPFIVNAAEVFTKTTDIHSYINEEDPNIFKFDVTDTFIDIAEHKLKITNKDKDIDFSDLVKDTIQFKQKLIIKISYDVPSFLALKNIESEIEKVQLIIQANPDNNFCTVYVNIITGSRSVYSVNIGSKYLRKTK